MTSRPYDGRTFRAQADRCRFFTALILQHVSANAPLRVLDIGCGTGEQLIDLARALPAASLAGVDISDANIRSARDAARKTPFADRLTFQAADYLDLREGPFDLVLSYSTLQLIPASGPTLAQKLLSDIAPGGVLVNNMPVRSPYNLSLLAVRRICRLLRGRATDAVILAAGRLLHGRDLDAGLLQERVIYMYSLPSHYDADFSRKLLASGVVEVVATCRAPHVSLAQLQHLITVFRRRQGPSRP
jgi:SAM-dependent methyltransferase